MARILVAEDEQGLRSFLAEALEMDGHDVDVVADGLEALDAVKRRAYDVLVTDLKMPHMDGMELMRALGDLRDDLDVVVLTANGTVDTAVEAMKLGAVDFLQKPLKGPSELRMIVRRAAERRALLIEKERLARESAEACPTLTWGAPVMGPVVRTIERVAAAPTSVLLLGESGVGKEIMARAIHALSPRHDKPFVAINCAAISESLLESELFGHEKGAFTGAAARRKGRLELADGGTFFLDEIGELKPELQSKLLRVLELKCFERVGGSQTVDVDVRWLAATNRDLSEQMAIGGFREDLYHRLAVFPIRIPSLRERREDIAPLARMLLARVGRELGRPGLELAPAAAALLAAQPWPGNVRELRNTLERAAIMADGERLETWHFSLAETGQPLLPQPAPADNAIAAATVPSPQHPPSSPQAADARSLREMERQAIIDALAAVDGNRQRAAERLGIGLRTLYDKLKRYEINA